MDRPARVAAIHDLSGVGRCSLTVILPVLSVMGVQACPVPTAVLSAHTGGLGEVQLRDLTDYLLPALQHYRSLSLSFECVYSGFLSTFAQLDHCLGFLRAYPDALAVVDPVMGDHGKPYRTVTPEMQSGMRSLVSAAGLITPNLTEACMLLGQPYDAAPMTHAQAKSMLVRLAKLGPKQVVITGVQLASGEAMANLGYDAGRDAFWLVSGDYLPASYPGTGDMFAAVLVGSLLRGDSLPMAMARADRFTRLAIKTTYGYGADPRYGVLFEPLLAQLASREVLSSYQIL